MSALPEPPSEPSWWPPDFGEWSAERQAEYLAAGHSAAIRPRLRYCPFTPTPKQAAFLLRPEREAFYGGAAGPGKSTALLMAALMFADVPGYSALLLRTTYHELSLPGALIPMAAGWLHGTGARYRGDKHTWTFPSGATLTFGYLRHSDDKYQYKSAQFAFIGFDEVTEFDEEDYTYLASRLRAPFSDVPALSDGLTLNDVPWRMRCASNPGGPGHLWVQERFVDAETREPDRAYIPALLTENPHLDRVAYARNLEMMTNPAERDRLLRGDWGVIDLGDVFNTARIMLVDDWAPVVAEIRYWDLAATEPHEGNKDPDYTTGAKIVLDQDGNSTVTEVVHVRVGPGAVERLVQMTAQHDGFQCPIYIEQDPGQAGKAQVAGYARLLPGYRVYPGFTKNADKRTRAQPAAAAYENGVLRLNRNMPNLRTIILEHQRFPNKGAHDDIVDAISGGYVNLTQKAGQTVTSVSSVAEYEPQSAATIAAGGILRTPMSVGEMMSRQRNR